MIEISRSTEVAASPQEVAALVTDLSRWPEWFALHKGWSDGIPDVRAATGVRFRHKVRVLGVGGDVTWEVADLQPPERFVLRGKGPSRSNMEVDFRIAPVGGGSQLAFTAKIGGLALRPFEGQIRPWLEVRVDRTVDALRSLLGTA